MARQFSSAVPVSAPQVSSVSGPVLQRKCGCGKRKVGCGGCSSCRRRQQGPVRRHAAQAGTIQHVPAIVSEVLSTPGSPLESSVRTFMESRFGYDFSRVRVHTDDRAAQSAAAVQADAYTVGRHVVFGAGRYAPATTAGRRLLAHELTHVVQQQSRTYDSGANLAIAATSDIAEQEADRVAEMVVSGHRAEVTIHDAPSLRRCDAPVSPPPPPQTQEAICGPDIEKVYIATVDKVKLFFLGQPDGKKDEMCDALVTLNPGKIVLGTKQMGWDVEPLLDSQKWQYSMINTAYPCGTVPTNGRPDCRGTVQIGSMCHKAVTANYYMFGVMMNQCYRWKSMLNPITYEYSYRGMQAMVYGYSGIKGVKNKFGAGLINNPAAMWGWASIGWNGARPSTYAVKTSEAPNCNLTCTAAKYPTAQFPKPCMKTRWLPFDTIPTTR